MIEYSFLGELSL